MTIGGGTNAHDGWRGLLRSVVGGFETGEGGEGTWMERRTPPSLLFWRPDDYECGYGWWMWMGPTIYPKRSMISKQNLKTKTCKTCVNYRVKLENQNSKWHGNSNPISQRKNNN